MSSVFVSSTIAYFKKKSDGLRREYLGLFILLLALFYFFFWGGGGGRGKTNTRDDDFSICYIKSQANDPLLIVIFPATAILIRAAQRPLSL